MTLIKVKLEASDIPGFSLRTLEPINFRCEWYEGGKMLVLKPSLFGFNGSDTEGKPRLYARPRRPQVKLTLEYNLIGFVSSNFGFDFLDFYISIKIQGKDLKVYF